jgi:hypothetical protein
MVDSSVARDTMSRKRLGRELRDGGKHPMYVSRVFPALRPLSIPSHGGHDLSTGVRDSILDQIEDDMGAWEKWLSERERKNGSGDNNDAR